MALRVLGEAATRTQGGDFAAIREFVGSEQFDLAAFKGQKLTFRDWDGQLRQPVLLTADTVVASVSPQAEFLHQVSQLDTLGIDRPGDDLHATGRKRMKRLAVLLASTALRRRARRWPRRSSSRTRRATRSPCSTARRTR